VGQCRSSNRDLSSPSFQDPGPKLAGDLNVHMCVNQLKLRFLAFWEYVTQDVTNQNHEGGREVLVQTGADSRQFC
jgi:hypothetical protein